MPVNSELKRDAAGNLYFADKDGNVIAHVDGTRRAFDVPIGATLAQAGAEVAGGVEWPLRVNAQPNLTGVEDSANSNEQALVVYPGSGAEVELIVSSAFTDGSTWTGARLADIGLGTIYLDAMINGSYSTTSIQVKAGSSGTIVAADGGPVIIEGATVTILPSIRCTEVAFASLPGSPAIGELANVSDSNTATWGANVADGGANHILARWNGTNWTCVGK
jgi:hypothetical protein